MSEAGASRSAPALRAAKPDDAALLFEWVNRPETLAVKLRTAGPIPWEVHRAWFARRLEDAAVGLWIVEVDGSPVGQVRLEPRQIDDAPGPAVEVDVFMTPETRGQGVGRAAVRQAIALYRREVATGPARVVAQVLPDNAGSLALFRGAGFVEWTRNSERILLEYDAAVDDAGPPNGESPG